jgi:hypothetical protein
MKTIPLSRGKFALVDDEDYDVLNRYTWHCNNSGYAMQRVRHGKEKRNIMMHRVILSCPDGMQTDHIDGNRLNNQRSNLRACNQSQNEINKRRRKTNTSGYKGVCYNGKYIIARVSANGKSYHLGIFPDKVSAAKAYDIKARELFGEFARLNFPGEYGV